MWTVRGEDRRSIARKMGSNGTRRRRPGQGTNCAVKRNTDHLSPGGDSVSPFGALFPLHNSLLWVALLWDTLISHISDPIVLSRISCLLRRAAAHGVDQPAVDKRFC